jgi:site-specific recombinase XerD
MGVKVKERDGAWWIFINHQGKRKAKRIGVREPGKRAARAAAEKIQAKLDLRHTFAPLAIQAGVPLLTVSRQHRHASISTTADLYTHAVPGSNRAAAEAMEAVLTSNQTQPPRNLPS